MQGPNGSAVKSFFKKALGENHAVGEAREANSSRCSDKLQEPACSCLLIVICLLIYWAMSLTTPDVFTQKQHITVAERPCHLP